MPPPRLVRRLKQGALALGSVTFLMGGFVGYLHTHAGNEWLRGKIEARVNEKISGSVQIGELSFSLASGVTVYKISLRDPSGVEAASLEQAHADPSLRQLLSGKVEISEVTARGLRLHLVQLAEGGTNLTKLLTPKPSTAPPKPSKPSKPLEFLKISKINLSDAEVDFKKLDGSWLTVTGIGAEARVEASPARKDLDASLSKLDASILLKRPDGQQVSISNFHTSIEAKLQGGAGQIKLLPMGASLGLELSDGRKIDPTPIALAGLSIGLSQEQITAGLQQLQLLALQVGSADARVGLASGAPNGTGEGSLGGVRLDKNKINTLLGQSLLLSDVDLEAKLDGSKEKPHLNLGLKTDGGTIKLALKLDASGLEKPKFTLDIGADELKIHKAIQLKEGASISLSSFVLTAKGSATSQSDAAADITLNLGSSQIQNTNLDKAHIEAHYEGGILTVKALSVEALGQKVEGRGSFTPASKALRAHIEVHGDPSSLGKALSNAGQKAPPPALLRGLQLKDGVSVDVDGSLENSLDLTLPGSRIGIAGGTASIEGKARLKKGADPSDPTRFVLEEGGASLNVQNIHIPSLLAMLGRPDRGLKGKIDGKIQVSGTKTAPSAVYDLKTTFVQGTESVRARARGKVSPGALAMDLDADRITGGTEDRLLHAEIKAPLVWIGKKPRIDPGRPLSVRASIPDRALKTLAGLLPNPLPSTIEGAHVGAEIALDGTMRSPEGTIQLNLSGPLLARLGGEQRARANVTLSPGENGSVQVSTDLQAWLQKEEAPHLVSKITVRLEKSPLIQPPKDASWTLDTTLQPQPLQAFLPPGKVRPGTIGLHILASGNRSDVTTKVEANLRGLISEKAPIDADLTLVVDETQSKVGLKVRGKEEALATLDGKLGLGGRGLIPRVREKQPLALDTPFDASITIPDRALTSLTPWLPALQGAPGNLSGKISLRGPITRISLDGGLALQDLPVADGSMARADLKLSGSPLQLSARLEARPASGEGLFVEARTSPLVLAGATKNGGTFPVTVTISGKDARLSTLIPPTSITRALEGIVNSDLQAKLEMQVGPTGIRPEKVTFNGALHVQDGTFQIPGSTRALRTLGLQLVGEENVLKLQKLEAHESDLEQSDRSLLATGQIAWDGIIPKGISLDLKSQKWLLFGGRLGPSDAPRASLDADLEVNVDFFPDIRKVRTKIRSLEFLSPDRFLRSHEQEQVSVGDIIEIQDPSQVGKLIRPATEKAPEPSEKKAAGGRVTEIEIELPSTAHIKQAPVDLFASGTVKVRLDGGERQTSGKLTVSGGSILIGGRIHKVQNGELRFDEEHPGGYLDIIFQRAPVAAALRDIATAEGEVIRVHLNGELGKQKAQYEGLGIGSLFDTLALNNAGRTRFLAEPDKAASQTSQLPQFINLRQMTFISVNLPHMLFLDRISVWADPYDSRSAYGRLFYHRGERYTNGGSTRIRTQTRAPGRIGESQGEAAYDLLFQNTPRTISGIGLKAGTRGGGGPELFWEWSSED